MKSVTTPHHRHLECISAPSYLMFLCLMLCTFSARGKWMGYWLCFEEERCETCTNWVRFWHRGIYKLQASQASVIL